MKRIAQFEKVSRERFIEDWLDTFMDDEQSKEDLIKWAESIYDKIKLPKRATQGSAGYDFFSPLTFTLKPGRQLRYPPASGLR